ncbi:unnamed protein product [Rotaria sordida]|uniref:Uncharacterized protein n=1 Tax=Rotaria sordida TaxID=392033 RepID=A0A815QMV4_9BILA|nr:unnamed protein product [Rotaria sordida]CAF1465421.1 unnamed protein product [Rotaria sordida]
MSSEKLYEQNMDTMEKLKMHTTRILLGIGMLIGLALLVIFIVILLVLAFAFLKSFNTNTMTDYGTGLSTFIFNSTVDHAVC